MYTEAVRRRKTATARVRIWTSSKSGSTTSGKATSVKVNDKSAEEYFPLLGMAKTALDALNSVGGAFTVSEKVRGGGHKAQAVAIRHATARALAEMNPEQRKDLKIRGYLKRDPRAKERKKFGLKAARRAPQWSKR